MKKEKQYKIWLPTIKEMSKAHTMEDLFHISDGDLSGYVILESIGLKDKEGNLLFEEDILHIRHKIGENENHYFDGFYKVNRLHYTGVSLSFLKLSNDDPNNQFPIHQSLSFEYRSLTTDHEKAGNDSLALNDTFGENTLSGTHWQQNYRSTDIVKVGTTFESASLINSPTTT